MRNKKGHHFLMKSNNRGFSLIEIIAVLIIVGIVSAVAISRGTSTAASNLAREFDTLKGHLRYAQAMAMNDTVAWNMSLNGGSYTLSKNGIGQNLPGEGSTHTFANGVSLSSAPTTISFDSWGSPGATTRTLVLNGSRTITITRNTGFIP